MCTYVPLPEQKPKRQYTEEEAQYVAEFYKVELAKAKKMLEGVNGFALANDRECNLQTFEQVKSKAPSSETLQAHAEAKARRNK